MMESLPCQNLPRTASCRSIYIALYIDMPQPGLTV